MGQISKNQRTTAKVQPKQYQCEAGHTLVRVLLSQRGRQRFVWACACVGFVPMTDKPGR